MSFERSFETRIQREKSPEEIFREKIESIKGLVETSRGLHSIIRERVYEGEENPEKRKRMVEKWGYNPIELEQKGKQIHNEWETLFQKALGGKLNEEEQKRRFRLEGCIFETTPDGKSLKHAAFHTGFTFELSRQIRKFLAASLALENPEEVRKIMEQPDVEITPEMIEEYIKKRNGPENETLFRSQNSLIETLSLPEKQKQYTLARAVLNIESRLER